MFKKLLCRVFGHDITYVMKGVMDGADLVYTGEGIKFRCERCGMVREPKEDERNEAMRELATQVIGENM